LEKADTTCFLEINPHYLPTGSKPAALQNRRLGLLRSALAGVSGMPDSAHGGWYPARAREVQD
jgi:hypothetical protein